MQRRDSNTEQKRFKRETITILHESLQENAFRQARSSFFKVYQKQYEKLTDEEKSQARLMLSRYGVLGRLVEHQAINLERFLDFWESTFKSDWDRLKSFVEVAREKFQKPKLFQATEKLAKKIAEGAS